MMIAHGGKEVKSSKLNTDELKKENTGSDSIVERRKFLSTGLLSAVAFAGAAISCLRDIFSLSVNNSEDS